MIVVSHPTGNANVRAVLTAANGANELFGFATSLGFAGGRRWHRVLPPAWGRELERRTYSLPRHRLFRHPTRECFRLLAQKARQRWLWAHEKGWASVDAVYRNHDRWVSRRLPHWSANAEIAAVYAYEDGADETFKAARRLGMKAIYDLPIAYWETAQRILSEEARRLPNWEPTLAGTRDSRQKLERKQRELEAADLVVCPSQFVADSLPAWARHKMAIVAAFGSPPADSRVEGDFSRRPSEPLRVLFAGSLTQRKGLADLFMAVRQLGRSDVELVVLGTPVVPLPFYRRELAGFRYEPSRPHAQVLELMRSCDVFCLPSLVEGRALVMQEAMSRGLPLIITPNTGGADLIDEGETGFLVPIRSPEAIAAKLAWCADHRAELREMGRRATRKAANYTWEHYGRIVVNAIAASSRT